jgi:peroxiredoxin
MHRVLSMSLTMLALAMLAGSALAEPGDPPKVGKKAPSFQLKDTEGQTHQLSDYRGQIVVLHFQQIGCPWEKAYQSALNELAEQHSAEQTNGQPAVQFLAINSNEGESVSELGQTKEERPVAYPILKDPQNKVADKYAARVTPHMYVIDSEGTLQYRGGIEELPNSPSQAGKMDQQHLEPVLNALVSGKDELPYTDTKVKGCGIKRSN